METNSTTKPILRAENVTKKYGENVIFHDISLSVHERDTIVIPDIDALERVAER